MEMEKIKKLVMEDVGRTGKVCRFLEKENPDYLDFLLKKWEEEGYDEYEILHFGEDDDLYYFIDEFIDEFFDNNSDLARLYFTEVEPNDKKVIMSGFNISGEKICSECFEDDPNCEHYPIRFGEYDHELDYGIYECANCGRTIII